MLIKVFGIWLMSTHISQLDFHEQDYKCDIIMAAGGRNVMIEHKNCDEVAAEINKQLKG